MAVYNLFLAARPSPDKAAAFSRFAEGLRQDCGLRGALIKTENLHVTLVEFVHTKELEQVILEKVLSAAKRIDLASFEVCFDRAMSFSSQGKPLVLTGSEGVAGFVVLQKALIAALHKEWLKIPPNRGYCPHMTLLYPGQEVAGFSIPPLSWTVSEFVLIRSLPGKSTHVILDRWPLRG